MWQRWYYAAKRSAQDDYNFEVDGDDRITRTYFIPRAEYLAGAPTYVPPNDGDSDPDPVRFPGYEFTEESIRRTDDKLLDSFFVVVQRTYVNTAKIISVSEEGTPRGEAGSETQLGSAKTATAVAPGIILQRSSRLTEFDLWHNTENRLALRVGVNQTSLADRVGYSETDTAELAAVEPSAAGGDVEFSKRLVTQDVAGADAIWAANRKTRVNDPANGSELTNFLGGGLLDVDVSLVADTASADSGFLVVESRVAPIGHGDAIKTSKTIDSYPTLEEWRYDAGLDSLIKITKDVIDPTLPSPNTPAELAMVSVGDITEIQPVDKWRSIRIRTQGMGVERTEMLPGIFSFQFPARLVSATMIGALAWAFNETNYDWDYDVAMVFDVKEAFSAALEGRVIRVVTNDPSLVLAAYPTTVFKPQSQTIALVTGAAYASEQTVWAKTSARTWQTPLTINAAITVSAPSWVVGALDLTSAVNLSIAATTPTTIPTGWITVGASSQRLRMGFWEVQIRQINSPGP
jgi:hypothetical protein